MLNALCRAARTRLARASSALVGIGIAASLLGGCVGQAEYDRLYETYNSVNAKNAELSRQVAELQSANDLMRKNVGAGEGTMSSIMKENETLRRQRDQAIADLKEFEKRVAGLSFGPVNPETDQALKVLAGQYPDLIQYDAARGTLRFASDLTFDSGSAHVKENARAALTALGNILNSPAASAYEVVIEGHTDSQRISSNTAAKHPTNRHLSTHRAISVIDELRGLSVPPERMLAAGWGEFRPLIPNTPSGNTPQNRRVEIFLARGRGTGTAEAPSTATTSVDPDQDAPPERPVDMMK
jgi:chemotaxis protein MotB